MFIYLYLYLITIFSLPTTWDIVGISLSVVWGTTSVYGLIVRTRMQRRKNSESSTVTFFIWVLIKAVKVCKEMELMWNDNLWMRVQNRAYKTVATSWVTNKQHERFNAIVQRIMLKLLFPLRTRKQTN